MVVCFSVAPPFCSEVSYEKTTISHDAIAMFNVVQATRFLCDLLIWHTTSKAEREKWRYPLEMLQLRAWEYCDVYKMTKLFFENKALMGLNISVHSIIVLVFLKYLKLWKTCPTLFLCWPFDEKWSQFKVQKISKCSNSKCICQSTICKTTSKTEKCHNEFFIHSEYPWTMFLKNKAIKIKRIIRQAL